MSEQMRKIMNIMEGGEKQGVNESEGNSLQSAANELGTELVEIGMTNYTPEKLVSLARHGKLDRLLADANASHEEWQDLAGNEYTSSSELESLVGPSLIDDIEWFVSTFNGSSN